jgi:hypothetical protein
LSLEEEVEEIHLEEEVELEVIIHLFQVVLK